MVLTSWLPIQNQAIRHIGGNPVTQADLDNPNSPLPEAQGVNTFFDRALEEVLTDHDWALATKSLLIGTSTTTETPVTPVGVPELSSSDTVRKYYMPVPPYDAAGIAVGSVNFEIVRVIRNSFVADWVPQNRRVYFFEAITNKNVYVDVIFKLSYTDVSGDMGVLFTRALAFKLALLMARPEAGKDNPRDVMLQDKYDKAIAEARMRDNSIGDEAVDGKRYWHQAATHGAGQTVPWQDTSGRWHMES